MGLLLETAARGTGRPRSSPGSCPAHDHRVLWTGTRRHPHGILVAHEFNPFTLGAVCFDVVARSHLGSILFGIADRSVPELVSKRPAGEPHLIAGPITPDDGTTRVAIMEDRPGRRPRPPDQRGDRNLALSEIKPPAAPTVALA
jgi:hypothetical protein